MFFYYRSIDDSDLVIYFVQNDISFSFSDSSSILLLDLILSRLTPVVRFRTDRGHKQLFQHNLLWVSK